MANDIILSETEIPFSVGLAFVAAAYTHIQDNTSDYSKIVSNFNSSLPEFSNTTLASLRLKRDPHFRGLTSTLATLWKKHLNQEDRRYPLQICDKAMAVTKEGYRGYAALGLRIQEAYKQGIHNLEGILEFLANLPSDNP